MRSAVQATLPGREGAVGKPSVWEPFVDKDGIRSLGRKPVRLVALPCQRYVWVCYPCDRARVRVLAVTASPAFRYPVLVLWPHVRLWRGLRGRDRFNPWRRRG